jgi:hypothetical protein
METFSELDVADCGALSTFSVLAHSPEIADSAGLSTGLSILFSALSVSAELSELSPESDSA